MRFRKRVVIPLLVLAVVLVIAGYAAPSYFGCRRSDIEPYRTDDTDLVVIYGGHKTENAINGYRLAEMSGSFVVSNGNQRELEVSRRARREYGFPEEKVMELEAETTLSAAVDVYKIAKEHGFKTVANVSSDNHLITIETLNNNLPKDITHTYHVTTDYTKFSKGDQTLECAIQETTLRTANDLGGYDLLLGKAVIKTFNFFAPIGRKLIGVRPPQE